MTYTYYSSDGNSPVPQPELLGLNQMDHMPFCSAHSPPLLIIPGILLISDFRLEFLCREWICVHGLIHVQRFLEQKLLFFQVFESFTLTFGFLLSTWFVFGDLLFLLYFFHDLLRSTDQVELHVEYSRLAFSGFFVDYFCHTHHWLERFQNLL